MHSPAMGCFSQLEDWDTLCWVWDMASGAMSYHLLFGDVQQGVSLIRQAVLWLLLYCKEVRAFPTSYILKSHEAHPSTTTPLQKYSSK